MKEGKMLIFRKEKDKLSGEKEKMFQVLSFFIILIAIFKE
jgi:hypothetical protein